MAQPAQTLELKQQLPDEVEQLVAPLLDGHEVRFALPADVTADGTYAGGWTVVTEQALIAVPQPGSAPPRRMALAQHTTVTAETLVGNGILVAGSNGDRSVVARYSMEHVPAYAALARTLTLEREGDAPPAEQRAAATNCPTCGRRLQRGTRVCRACTNRWGMARRLWEVARGHLPLLLGALVLFLLHTGLNLLVPQLTRVLIDDYLVPQRAALGAMLSIVAAMGSTMLVIAVADAIRGRAMAKVAHGLERDLRAMVYTKVQGLSLSYLTGRETGDLLTRVGHDTRRIQSFIQFWFADGLTQALFLVAISVVLFLRDWRLALIVLAPLPAVFFISSGMWQRVRVLFRREWRAFDKVDTLLQDILSGIRVVKAFGRERHEVSRFRGRSATLRDIIITNEQTWAVLIPIFGMIMRVGEFLVLLIGGYLVLGEQLQLGELVQFTQYAVMLYGPMTFIGGLPKRFADSMTAAERVFEIIDEQPEISDRPSARRKRLDGNVELDQVTFGYDAHEIVLDRVSMKVEAGEMIGLVGHSGAGKSTLINLLMRLYDVQEGAIRIDGIDLRDLSLSDLRTQTGVVLQETFLFSGTVHENIAYSKPGASHAEVIAAARVANAHDFIVQFPDGYDTRVGERGHRLSGGERQRVAIARAVLHDPRILILDEATSAVDTETEQQIQEALFHLIKGRTTFAIAHRLSTLRNADRLVVLEKGKVAELGSHRELMERGGIYHDLVLAQRKMSRTQAVSG